MKQQNLQGVVNYHAMGRIIYGDCTKGSLKKDTYKMYDIAKKITGYSKAPDGGSGKSWGGQYREYVMDLLNKPSITIEIGSSVAPCPHWQSSKYRDQPVSQNRKTKTSEASWYS